MLRPELSFETENLEALFCRAPELKEQHAEEEFDALFCRAPELDALFCRAPEL